MAVLTLLAARDMYGYELAEAIDRQSNGVLSMGHSTLYSLLYNLEGKGLIESYEVKGEDGRVRRYYRLVVRSEGKKKPKAENLPVAAPSFTLLPESV